MNWLALAWLANWWGPVVAAGAIARSIGTGSGGGTGGGGGGGSGGGPSIQVAQSTGDFSNAVVVWSAVAAQGGQPGGGTGGNGRGGTAGGNGQGRAAGGSNPGAAAGRMSSPSQGMRQSGGEVFTFRFDGSQTARPQTRSRRHGRRARRPSNARNRQE
jgi:hypothetical protein